MTDVAQRQQVERAVPLALFTAFLIVSLCGFSGGIVWARRIAVENRRWISDREFADIVSLCQFMPGPNIIGIAVCIGAKVRGGVGTIAAISGFLVIPWAAGLSLGVLYLEYAHLAVLRNVLGGIARRRPGF
jgi:chromate transporter